MELGQIAIGDIVSLKSHPYFLNVNDILISGEPLQLPPLMIVIEIFESKKSGGESSSVEYTCLWFSSKTNKFERSKIRGVFLKLLYKCEVITPQSLKAGDLLSLKTVDYELTKLKSSLHFEDTSVNQGNGSASITALLSFLPPTLQFLDIKEIKEKPSDSKNAKHQRSQYQVKCLWFNNVHDKFSEEVLPLEALQIIPLISEKNVADLRKCIELNKTLKFSKKDETYLIKPRSISARSGYYFLRGYDYITNKIIEIKIEPDNTFKAVDSAFVKAAPEFNIAKNPQAGSSLFIHDEFVTIVREAKKQKAFLRIKYKNRNDEISYRSLKNYEIIQAEEDNNYLFYIIGFCMLRQSTRTFRISRIQNIQQLDMHFS